MKSDQIDTLDNAAPYPYYRGDAYAMGAEEQLVTYAKTRLATSPLHALLMVDQISKDQKELSDLIQKRTVENANP